MAEPGVPKLKKGGSPFYLLGLITILLSSCAHPQGEGGIRGAWLSPYLREKLVLGPNHVGKRIFYTTKLGTAILPITRWQLLGDQLTLTYGSAQVADAPSKRAGDSLRRAFPHVDPQETATVHVSNDRLELKEWGATVYYDRVSDEHRE